MLLCTITEATTKRIIHVSMSCDTHQKTTVPARLAAGGRKEGVVTHQNILARFQVQKNPLLRIESIVDISCKPFLSYSDSRTPLPACLHWLRFDCVLKRPLIVVGVTVVVCREWGLREDDWMDLGADKRITHKVS